MALGKRLALASGALLTTLAIVAPGLIGGLAEARHTALVADLAAGPAAGTLSVLSYERGWFRSTARYRVAWAPRDPSGGVPPRRALVVDSIIKHGPFAPREPGTFVPVLTRALSTVSLETAGGPQRLPGTIDTVITLAGNGSMRYQAAAASGQLIDGRLLEWDGADLRARFDKNLRHVTVDGRMGRLALHSGGHPPITLGPATLSGQQQRSKSTPWSGTTELHIEEISGLGIRGTRVDATDVAVRTVLSVGGGRASLGIDATAGRVSGEDWDGGEAVLRLRADDLDAAALAAVLGALEGLGTEVPLAEAGELLRPALSTLLVAGGAIDLSRLSAPTPYGRVEGSLAISLPPQGQNPEAAALLQTGEGELWLELPRTLALRAAARDADLMNLFRTALRLGLLRSAGAAYRTHVRYARGQLFVNGVRMPGFGVL